MPVLVQVGLDSAYFQTQNTEQPSCGLQARVGAARSGLAFAAPRGRVPSGKGASVPLSLCRNLELHVSVPMIGTGGLHQPKALSCGYRYPQFSSPLYLCKCMEMQQNCTKGKSTAHQTGASRLNSVILEAQLGGTGQDSAQEWAVVHDWHKHHSNMGAARRA